MILTDTDDRRACAECAHYMPGRWHCGNHRRAGLRPATALGGRSPRKTGTTLER